MAVNSYQSGRLYFFYDFFFEKTHMKKRVAIRAIIQRKKKVLPDLQQKHPPKVRENPTRKVVKKKLILGLRSPYFAGQYANYGRITNP
jgi:hypothetical protein